MTDTQAAQGPFRVDVVDALTIEWDVPIETDDGVTLRAGVFRPTAPGAYPIILSYGPYGKGLRFQQSFPKEWQQLIAEYPEVMEGSSGNYQNWEVADPEKWVPDGYVCVRVDARGSGRSPGYLELNAQREIRDLYACIEWAAAQPWSNGRVGLNGISYLAMNQWRVAALQPPHLSAICVWEGAGDLYRDASYHGGIRSSFVAGWFRGHRQANAALYRIVIVRLRWHQPTMDYVTRRTAQGLSKRDIVRCLKRFVAREVYRALLADHAARSAALPTDALAVAA